MSFLQNKNNTHGTIDWQ